MRSWIELFDAHMTDVSGCTIKAACDALRDAAQAFCRRTKAWRQDLDPVLTQARQEVYDFDLSNEVEIVRVLSAQLAGQPIELQNSVRPGDRCVRVLSPIQFSLHPAQAKGLKLVFHAALEPSTTASGMDDWFADRYAQALARGAKARLLAQSGMPYSDPNRAMMLAAEFEQDIADATGDVSSSFSSAPVRIEPQFF